MTQNEAAQAPINNEPPKKEEPVNEEKDLFEDMPDFEQKTEEAPIQGDENNVE